MKKKILLYICVFCLFFTNISSILASEAEIETIPVSAEVLEGVQVQEVQNPEIEVDNTADLGITAVSCILMEASTGKVIYEKNADQALSPASITKIMTLILIFDALKDGKIKLDDEVTTSAYAKSMGGSQVFLEEGEKQTVETLIKCIVVASGNDASVANIGRAHV